MKKIIFLICLALGSCNKFPIDPSTDSFVYSWFKTCAASSDYSTFCEVAQTADVGLYSDNNYNSGPTLVIVSNSGMDAYLAKSGQSSSDLIGNSSAAKAFFADYVLNGNITKSEAIKTLGGKTVQVSNTASGVALNGIAVQKTQILSSNAPILFINQVLF